MNTETIAAVATAAGNSGIGIVRISGSECFDIIDQIYSGNKKLSECPANTIHYGHIVDETEIIDEVMVSIMRAPASYTREDTIEINCHGGMKVVRCVLDTVIKHGARIAEPGEFTKRAFLNGRIDLSQAEAVMDVIHAQNDMALKSSISQLKGSMKYKIEALRKKVLYEIAFIESALDDPEHISLDGYAEALDLKISEYQEEMRQLLRTAQNGRLVKEGIKTVILGKPNAGKSSLLNALTGKERAIVTEIEGTTRDIIEETIVLDDITLQIIDTAGIRVTEDEVEKIGVKKAKDYASDADLILYVADSSRELNENDDEIIGLLNEKKSIVLLNKSDLDQVITEDLMKEKVNRPVISVSAKQESGIHDLEEMIKEMFFKGDIAFNDQVYITNMRHEQAVREALDSISLVKESIAAGMPEDFYSIDLMNAYEKLGLVIGETVDEDLVNEIFSKFCTGK